MPLFSERLGFVAPRDVLQVECSSEDLRISIYNIVHEILGDYEHNSIPEEVCEDLWTRRWHKPIDTFPLYSYDFYKTLYSWVLDGDWYNCYDLLEFVYGELRELGAFDPDPMRFGYGSFHGQPQPNIVKEVHEAINEVLEAEGSGYRFLDGQVAQITNELELATLEQSLDVPDEFSSASAHIEQSLKLLSKKPEPDYLNSVKESISAAESAAICAAPGKNKTLAEAVDAMQRVNDLHKSLAESWKRMFGYTSDANGIRHGSSGEPVSLDFAFAKYMLVTCSAFVNYLAEEFGQDE